MSRTLDLNKVSKARKARKAWELLQKQQEKEKIGKQLDQIRSNISLNRDTDEKMLKRSS